MRQKISFLLTVVIVIASISLLVGCRRMTSENVEALYGYQLNFSRGTATLNIIPETMVLDLYENFDTFKDNGIKHLPIQIREYAVTNTVYFDYDTDCSVVWDKNNGDVRIEHTDTAERDDFMQKQHK